MLSVGVSVAAPGCWIPGYNFYTFYVLQMSCPVRSFPSMSHSAPQGHNDPLLALHWTAESCVILTQPLMNSLLQQRVMLTACTSRRLKRARLSAGWNVQIILVLLCLGVLFGALKAGRRLDVYVEEGPYVKQLPVRKAEAWQKKLGNLQTR